MPKHKKKIFFCNSKTADIFSVGKDPMDYLNDNVLFLSLSTDFNVISANDIFFGLTGLKEKGLKNINFLSHLCRGLPSHIFQELQHLMCQQKSWNGNFAFTNQEGLSSWFYTNVIPACDETGTYIGFNVIATIGKAKQSLISEKATTEIWMKSVFNDTDESKILIETDGCIIEYNTTAFEFMSLYTHKKLRLSENVTQYFDEFFANTLEVFIEKAKKGRKQKICRAFRNLGGYEKIVEIQLKPVISSDDVVKGIIFTVNDITEEAKLEKRIKISEKKLDDIAFINAHEVRAPLASILGLLHLLDFEEFNMNRGTILSHLKSLPKN